MKNRLINSLLSLVFVVTMVSCKKQEDVIPDQKSNPSSFRVSKTQSSSNFGESAYTTFTITGSGGKYATFTFKPGGTNITTGFQVFNTVNPGGMFVISQEAYLMLINGDFDMEDGDGDDDGDDDGNPTQCLSVYNEIFSDLMSLTVNSSCTQLKSVYDQLEEVQQCPGLPDATGEAIDDQLDELFDILDEEGCF